MGGDAHPQRRSHRQHRAPDDEDPDGATTSEPDEGREEQRPHQVVLLLHGQRPRVHERVGRLEVREVVVAGGQLLPVGEVQERRHGGGAQLGRHDPGPPEQRVESQRHEQQQQGGEQSPSPPRPEGPQADPSGCSLLREQQARDQEPGQDEEDVHAVPAASEEPEVIGDDGRDGHAAHTVERWPVPMFAHSSEDSASHTRPRCHATGAGNRATSASGSACGKLGATSETPDARKRLTRKGAVPARRAVRSARR